MKKKLMYLIAFLIIFGGIGLLCYPSFASFINQKMAYTEISEYDEKMEQMSKANMEKMLQLANDYNQALPGSFPADPFSGEYITDFEGTEFEDFFMTQEGEMLGYVEVPDINVYLPIYYGTKEDVLQKGAGLVLNSSIPVGGSGTHAVVSAHTGLANKKMFTDLVDVKEGAIFFIHILDKSLAYQVNQIKVVKPDETNDLLIQKDKDYVTLLTCTPFGVNDHRLLVRGERIDYDFENNESENSALYIGRKDMYMWMVVIGAFGITIILLRIIGQKEKRKMRRARKKRWKNICKNRKKKGRR